MSSTLLQHQQFLIRQKTVQVHHPRVLGGGRGNNLLSRRRSRMALRKRRAPRVPGGAPLDSGP
eukprot:1843143-Rhodomonas_salina.4